MDPKDADELEPMDEDFDFRNSVAQLAGFFTDTDGDDFDFPELYSYDKKEREAEIAFRHAIAPNDADDFPEADPIIAAWLPVEKKIAKAMKAFFPDKKYKRKSLDYRWLPKPKRIKAYQEAYYERRGEGYRKQRFNFLGFAVKLDYIPRIGVCNGASVVPFDCKLTALHHESYNPKDPLADTIELCPRCHGKADRERRRREGSISPYISAK